MGPGAHSFMLSWRHDNLGLAVCPVKPEKLKKELRQKFFWEVVPPTPFNHDMIWETVPISLKESSWHLCWWKHLLDSNKKLVLKFIPIQVWIFHWFEAHELTRKNTITNFWKHVRFESCFSCFEGFTWHTWSGVNSVSSVNSISYEFNLIKVMQQLVQQVFMIFYPILSWHTN